MKRAFFTTALLVLLLMCGGVVKGQMVQELTNLPDSHISCCSHPEAGILYAGGLHGVYKSTDNGETWDMVYEYDTVVHIPLSLEDTVFSLPFFYMNFMNETVGFASKARNAKSEYLFDRESVSGHPSHDDSSGLFKTSDGGATWNMVDSSHFFVNLQFAGTDTVFAHEKRERALYRSIDGGANWSKVFGEGVPMDDYSSVGGGLVYVIKGAGYLDENGGLGEDPVLPAVYKSSDGGETWTMILNNTESLSKPPVYIDIIHFHEEGKGVLMGHRQIFTDDDFSTYEWQGGGFTGITYAGRNVQSCYLNSGHVVSTCASADGVQDDIKLRISRNFGRHTSCQTLCGSYLGVAAITGCEEDTTFFALVDGNLYRINGSYFPPLGIAEHERNTVITVAPNPVNDILHVEVTGGDAGIAHVEMFDMFGRNISVETHGRASLPSLTTTVNTSAIPSGLYVLRVTLTDDTVRNVKVVKE